MFDLHSHILPGIDDGADTLEEAVKMARIASSAGTRGIAATPHANLPDSWENYWTEAMLARVNKLQYALDAAGIPLQLYTGQEIFLRENTVRLLEKGQLITINRTRYVLVELDFREEGQRAVFLLESLLEAGYIPLVAHPERYHFVIRDPEAAWHLKNMGCLLQINRGSLNGSFGSRVQKTAHILCRRRLADIVASDSHSPYVRTPYMQDVQEMLTELYTERYARLLLHTNPVRILCDRETIDLNVNANTKGE